MGFVPQSFPQLPNSAIASYPYSDISEGTGVVKYQACKLQNNSTTTNLLLTTNIQADPTTTVTVWDNATNPAETTTYEVMFNTPKDIMGDLYFKIPLAIASSAAQTASVYYTITVYKYSGSATSLGAVTTRTLTGGGSSTTYDYICTSLNIATKIHFARGDKLQVKIQSYIGRDGATTVTLINAHNPAGTAWSTITQDLNVYVPFVLDN